MVGENVSVFCDIDCHLGEGPTFDPGSGKVFWFDIVGRKLLEKRWPDGETIVHDLPEMASALGVVDDARQLLVTETGLHLRAVDTGALSLVQPIEAEDKATRSNDSRVHPSGAFWIGTMGKHAEDRAGAIYWYRRGELRRLYADIGIPNSICFSPDGSIAYFADTATNILHRINCDPATGLPRGEPEVFLDHRDREGGIDGSVVDAEGRLWNARWGAGALDCYLPDGTHVGRIAIPASQSTCPAFAGPDARGMVVTTAWQGMDATARASDPQAGKTFVLEPGVTGRHEPRVAL